MYLRITQRSSVKGEDHNVPLASRKKVKNRMTERKEMTAKSINGILPNKATSIPERFTFTSLLRRRLARMLLHLVFRPMSFLTSHTAVATWSLDSFVDAALARLQLDLIHRFLSAIVAAFDRVYFGFMLRPMSFMAVDVAISSFVTNAFFVASFARQ